MMILTLLKFKAIKNDKDAWIKQFGKLLRSSPGGAKVGHQKSSPDRPRAARADAAARCAAPERGDQDHEDAGASQRGEPLRHLRGPLWSHTAVKRQEENGKM